PHTSHLHLDRPSAHRDSLLFPTRRSSDLLCCQAFSLACVDLGLPNPLAQRLQGNSEILGDHFHGFAALTHETNGLGTKLRWVWRSEEHTSELQSRENLVCRLLRGKKTSAI